MSIFNSKNIVITLNLNFHIPFTCRASRRLAIKFGFVVMPGGHFLESSLVEVYPGLPLPAAAADFIFNRLDWIRQGGEKPFHYVAPHPGDYHDLCTLAYLIDNRETSLAHDLVRLLPRPPSILLPSATATAFNDNYLHVNPFRRRMRRRRRSTTSSPLKPEVCKFSCY